MSPEAAVAGKALELLQPKLLADARSLVGSSDAPDLVQDAMVAVLTRRSRLNDQSALRAYLRRTMRNLAIDRYRARGPETVSLERFPL